MAELITETLGSRYESRLPTLAGPPPDDPIAQSCAQITLLSYDLDAALKPGQRLAGPGLDNDTGLSRLITHVKSIVPAPEGSPRTWMVREVFDRCMVELGPDAQTLPVSCVMGTPSFSELWMCSSY